MKKIDLILLKILAASLLLYLISLVFSPERANSQKSIESAILNQKYKNDIQKILLKKNDENDATKEIEITKHGDFYLLSESESNINCLADSKIIASLLENAVKIRKFYKISQKSSDSALFLTDEKSAFSIAFYADSDNAVSQVFFGAEDSLKNRIYLRSKNSNAVYECENDFHQYLTIEKKYWAEGKIFAESGSPVQIDFEKLNQNGIPSEILKIDDKSEDFQKKSEYLLSLRHGNITDEVPLGFQKVTVLKLQDGNGRIVKIEFFQSAENTGEGDSNSYYYIKSVIPSPIDAQSTAFAFYSENAVYEISAWTYGKIRDLFLN